MRFVIGHVSIEDLPDGHEFGAVQMPLFPGELDDVDGPVADVLLQDALVPLQMEGAD